MTAAERAAAAEQHAAEAWRQAADENLGEREMELAREAWQRRGDWRSPARGLNTQPPARAGTNERNGTMTSRTRERRPAYYPGQVVALYSEPCCEGPCAHEFEESLPELARILHVERHRYNRAWILGYQVQEALSSEPRTIKPGNIVGLSSPEELAQVEAEMRAYYEQEPEQFADAELGA
jgi:hypothetical protein